MPKSPEQAESSPEEIKRVEETMTSEKAEKIGVPENVRKAVSERLNGLSARRLEDVDVEGQCQERFGRNWADVRKEVEERISKGFELLPENKQGQSLRLEPKSLLEKIMQQSGNWMVNRCMEALYLKYSHNNPSSDAYSLEYLSKDLTELDPEASDPEPFKQSCIVGILGAAPYVDPERVEQILQDWNLK